MFTKNVKGLGLLLAALCLLVLGIGYPTTSAYAIATCEEPKVVLTPSNTAYQGQVVKIDITAKCEGEVGLISVNVGMSVLAKIQNSSSVSVKWDTREVSPGNVRIYVDAFAKGNDLSAFAGRYQFDYTIIAGQTPAPTATLQPKATKPTPQSTPTKKPNVPKVTPQSKSTKTPLPNTVVENPCNNGSPKSQLMVGMKGVTLREAGTNLRKAAGTTQELVEKFTPGNKFLVIGGPKCLSASTWWEVEMATGEIGWMCEGFKGDGYYIGPDDGKTPTSTPTPTAKPPLPRVAVPQGRKPTAPIRHSPLHPIRTV